jgi:phosphate-selective porin OprO/OprP
MLRIICGTLLAVANLPGTASADQAETKGGIKIRSDDGSFEAGIGGRIHFDAYFVDEDREATFGSSGLLDQGGTAFRRTYLTLTGKAYGWRYKFENDFASGASPGSYRDMWISTDLLGGDILIGQFKPFRGMEEHTSSNELTLIERPVASASGIYAGRQYLMGLGYKAVARGRVGYQAAVMSLSPAGTGPTEGIHYGGRLYAAPLAEPGGALHLGVSASVDDEGPGSAAASPAFAYAGRRGPVVNFGNAGGAGGVPIDAASQSTIAAEAAGSWGPVTLQAEYAQAVLDGTHISGTGAADSNVVAYYLQASWFLTGERAPYKIERGAFGKPKPLGEHGAWELAARYESIENTDDDGIVAICTITTGATGTFAAGDACMAKVATAGVNWYVNPNVRFMLNYYLGEASNGAEKDKPQAATLRTQLSF